MDHDKVQLVVEAAARAAQEAARLHAIAGVDTDGEWAERVSYPLGSLTVIDLKDKGSEAREAS